MLEIQAWQFSIAGAVLRSKSKDTIQISIEIKVTSYVVVGVRRIGFLSFPILLMHFRRIYSGVLLPFGEYQWCGIK